MNRKAPRILIVDDDETLAQVMRRVFETWCWDTRKALDCKTALAYLDSEERFDLVLLDLVLPDCDGIEVLRRIRERDDPVTVIVSTGKPPHECAEVATLKPDVLAQKPYLFEPVRSLADRIYARFFEERMVRPAEPETAKARSK